MARKRHAEIEANHEAWAIPYADLITLLLAFFVVMYAISTVNESKYRVLSDSLSDAFSGPPRSVTPVKVGAVIRRGVDSDIRIDIRPRLNLQGFPQPVRLPPPVLATQSQDALNRDLAAQLEAQLPDLLAQGQISVKALPDRVEIEVGSDLLFASGSARVEAGGDVVLRRIAQALSALPYPVRVEGHTDNVPIATWQFPSNWELSASRAAWVVRRFAELGVAAQRLSMRGFGEFQPVADNATRAGRQANRRVAVVIDTRGGDAPRTQPGRDLVAVRGPNPANRGP